MKIKLKSKIKKLINLLKRIKKFISIFLLNDFERVYRKAIVKSELFDARFYNSTYPQIHWIMRFFPVRHYIVYGEKQGLAPNPDFSSSDYIRYNPDVAKGNINPFFHYVTIGHSENRITKSFFANDPSFDMDVNLSQYKMDGECKKKYAIVTHMYYADLWSEFRSYLDRLEIDFDLYITITYKGVETDNLMAEIAIAYPSAIVIPFSNRGRDILPFMSLINAGLLSDYEAVCKIHTKKSLHRQDGAEWRRHLISDILPETGLTCLLEKFLQDSDAAFWVANGQHYSGSDWWGSNFELSQLLMRRLEVEIDRKNLNFPAGSMYWIKPLMIGMLKSLNINANDFELENSQVDGTMAHALERSMGLIAHAAGQKVVETEQIKNSTPDKLVKTIPRFVSAFYLPQFHPIQENDQWWGKGFTEWRGVVSADCFFEGHTQPLLPSDFGFYDLRLPEVMGEQAAVAMESGVDAFCVYHYWFDGRRVLEAPLDNLLNKIEINFPFYLCWANESWRRNWDGLSGTLLLEQTYRDGFEAALVRDSLPYMRDKRYARPDGNRPRFIIYRPEDIPNPVESIARMRVAWEDAGIGPVELGAVRFHIEGAHPVPDDLFDFWVEMPPHGMVAESDYLFGGGSGNLINKNINPEFKGLIYSYVNLIGNSIDPNYFNKLPHNTICGLMPSWDNTARRGLSSHIAYGANPASFGLWLKKIINIRLQKSYRQEIFINAWNEWAEKAVLEPSQKWGRLYLDVIKNIIGRDNNSN